MPDPPTDAKGLFLAALDIADAAERAAFVERSCSGDAALRQRVEDLLRAYGQSNGPLDKLAAALASTKLSEPIPEQVGATIGPYKLMEQIGEGGFGLVFVAEQQQPIRRKVALKIIKPGMDTRDVIARFEAERQALALMDHPNIARVLDAGTTQSGHPYFVMELVRGVPITEYCDKHQLTPRERLELFVPVCNAIQHAHLKGIIHRDIKPSNVLVTLHDGKPVVKVIDFGVAKALHQQLTDRTIYTRFAQMIGTPLYMSPEQAEMSGLDIDTRTDVYSLGVLLYELLTGMTPFDKKRLAKAAYDELLKIIREEDPPKPSLRLSQSSESLPSIAALRKTEPAKLSKIFSGDLDWITMKALEKDRTRRYETANAFAADVSRYLNDEPVEASPPSTVYRLRKLARKHRTALATAGSFAALLLAGVVVSATLAVRENTARNAADRNAQAARDEAEKARTARLAEEQQRHRAEEAQVEADISAKQAHAETLRALHAEDMALANADHARRNRYRSDIQLADQRWERGDALGAKAVLRRYAAPSADNDLRGWEWHYQERLCHQELRTFRGHGAILKGTAGPSATGISDTTADETDVNAIAFAPDGRRLATVGDDGSVRIWDVATAETLMTLKGHTRRVTSVAFSPDGECLASAAPDSSIRIWSARTGAPLAVLHVPAIGVNAIAFSPDGARLASMDWRGEVRFWDRASAQSIRSLKPFGESKITVGDSRFSATSASFSTNLGRVAVFGLPAVLFGSGGVCNLNNGETGLIPVPFSGRYLFTCLRLSPDGKQLATCWEGAPISLRTVLDRQAVTREFDGPIERGLSLAFTPDGVILACGEATGRISLWQVHDGKLLRSFAGHSGPVKCLSFNLDGGRLASGSSDGTVKLWDTLGTKLRAVHQVDSRLVKLEMQTDAGSVFTLFFPQSMEVATPREALTARSVRLLSAVGRVGEIAVSQSGEFIAALNPDSEPRDFSIWAARTGVGTRQDLSVLPRHQCRAICFQSDSSCLAILVGRNPASLTVVPATPPSRPHIKLELSPINGKSVEQIDDVAFSADGTRVAAALTSNGRAHAVEIWELPSCKAVRSINDLPSRVDALRFGRDGRLALRCGRRIYLGHISKQGKPDLLEGSLQHDASPKVAGMSHDGTLQLDASPLSLSVSRDGRTLAAVDGNDIAVWNLENGNPVPTIHAGSEVGCMGLSPDGSRLVAGTGRVLRIWDVRSGLELRSVTGHTGKINAVVFSSDGYRLITGSDDQTIRIYDARPITTELQIESEACTLCEALAESASSEAELESRIDTYPGVPDAARRSAKEVAPQVWNAEVEYRAKTVVNSLSAKILLKEDLLKRLQSDQSLIKEVRAAAINRASRIEENPTRLNEASWKIAVRADASSSDYQFALRAAKEAEVLSPYNYDIANTLGVAQYRVKSYADAIVTLSRSNDPYSYGVEERQATNLAFLAMAHHALGHTAEAQAFLRQLAELLKQDRWKSDKQANALFEEARQAMSKKP